MVNFEPCRVDRTVKVGDEFAVLHGRVLDRHRFRLKKPGKVVERARGADAEGEKGGEPTTAYPDCSCRRSAPIDEKCHLDETQ